MIFTEGQVEQFRTEGYLTVSDFWSNEETEAMRAEVERLKSEGKLRNVATDDDGETQSQVKSNLQLCPMSPHSELFRALPFAPKTVDAVRQLIGDPVVLHLDQVFLKPAMHGVGTNWHQDNAYFKIQDPLKGTAMWTAVHAATIANGTLRVIPRAFEVQLNHQRDPQSDHHVRCYPDERLALPLELPAGGVAFFAYGTPHATGANTTGSDRAGAAFHFLNANCIPADYFDADIASRQRHPVLTGADASDGSTEYGEPIAGAWDALVNRSRR